MLGKDTATPLNVGCVELILEQWRTPRDEEIIDTEEFKARSRALIEKGMPEQDAVDYLLYIHRPSTFPLNPVEREALDALREKFAKVLMASN